MPLLEWVSMAAQRQDVRRSQAPRVLARFAVVVVRIVACLLALQVSGIAHFVCDVVFDDDMTCADERDHSPDKSRCPLGGAHAQGEVIAAPPVDAKRVPIAPPQRGAVTMTDGPSVPTGRDVLGDVFRPPRAKATA